MFAVPNKSNSRFKNLGFAMFGGRPWRIQDLFANADADSGGLYTPNPLQYETVGSPWAAADVVADPVGLMLSKLGDGRGVVNILLNTATLSTQNVTTLAQDYTLFFSGAGTVELSGTATLAASPAGTYTFTATAGTLTVTVSGTVTDAQINAGSTALPYQANTYTVGGPGIHASQSTAGSRPTIASIPRGGRRNQLLQSNNQELSPWGNFASNGTIATNAGPRINGQNTARKLVENAGGGTKAVSQQISARASTTYVAWYRLRADGRTTGRIRFGGASFIASVVFDLSDGSVSLAGTGTVGSQQLSNDYWLIWVSGVSGGADTFLTSTLYLQNPSGTDTYTGDGTSGMLIDGAMLELGSTPTAYQNVTSNFLVTQDGVPQAPNRTYTDGADSMQLGTNVFGTATAGFRSSAADNWNITVTQAGFGSGVLASQTAQATATDRMFEIGIATDGSMYVILHGTTNTILPAGSCNDGSSNVASINCAAGVVTASVNGGARTALTVGAAAAETCNILFFARNPTTPAGFYTGYPEVPYFIDENLPVTQEQQVQAYFVGQLGIA